MQTFFPRILVTGYKGQLACALHRHPLNRYFEFVASSHAMLDISDDAALKKNLDQINPQIIINAAAFTAVDRAEEHGLKATQANVEGVRNLARACKERNIPMIHISTDYVFDGNSTRPYTEDDPAEPVNHYGKTKRQGEEIVSEMLSDYIILRVSGVFSEYGNNFLKKILEMAQTSTELRVVYDQVICPTSAKDIAGVIYTIARCYFFDREKFKPGIYHYCSKIPITWFHFAMTALSEASTYKHLTISLSPVSSEEYNALAKRPSYSVLDCSKILRDYGIEQPIWKPAMEQVVKSFFVSPSF
jgi:dTDP-4-dehydrorhamnose reductase